MRITVSDNGDLVIPGDSVSGISPKPGDQFDFTTNPAGLESARARGRTGGRRRLMTGTKVEAAKQRLASGTAPREFASNLGVSIATLYRWFPAEDRI